MAENKKTVGIITMHRVINYGSALQTYATVKAVEMLGFSPVVIDYMYPAEYHFDHIKETANKIYKVLLRTFLKRMCKRLKVMSVVHFTRRILCDNIRVREFKKFLNTLNLTKKYTKESILKNSPFFDIYLTGSDQTWNPRFLYRDYSFLLNFAPKKAPKISYAASFGSTELQIEFIEPYKKYLSRYDRISVRESSGVELIRNLTGQTAEHVLDPTLLLNQDDWQNLVKDDETLPEHFIFCYALDYVFNPAPEIFDLLKHLKKLLNMEVLFFATKKLQSEACKHGFVQDIPLSPESFITRYAKADFVVTTSFHGTAFSVNFHKNFYSVLNPNPSKDDRVKNFLSSVGMENRGLNLKNISLDSITEKDIYTDYTQCDPRLEAMRKKSWAYLEEALDFASQKADRR